MGYCFVIKTYSSSSRFGVIHWFFSRVTCLGLRRIEEFFSFPDFFSYIFAAIGLKLGLKSSSSSLRFGVIHWFLPKLRALDLEELRNISVFQTFFLHCPSYNFSLSLWIGIIYHRIVTLDTRKCHDLDHDLDPRSLVKGPGHIATL